MISGLLGLFLIFQQTFVPPDYQSIQKGIAHIYSVQFDSAKTIFNSYIKKHPDRPEGYFFLSMVSWWNIILDIENTALDEPFMKEMDKVIEKCETFIDNDLFADIALYYKGGCLGFKARLMANRKQWVSAANNGRKAYPIVSAALDGQFKFTDAKFGIGIYKYYADMIPEKYPILKPVMFFFPPGNRAEGLKALLDVKDNGLFARDEAAYFLINIYNNQEMNYKGAFELSKMLISKYPNNPYFKLTYGSSLLSTAQYEAGKKVYEDYLKNIEKNVRFYHVYQKTQVYYALGNANAYLKNYNTAQEFYEKSITYYQSNPKNGQTNYYVESLLQTAYSLKKNGKADEAKKRFNLVLTLPDNSNSHERAKNGLYK